MIGGNSLGIDDGIVEGVTDLRVNGAHVEDISSAVISLLGDPEKPRATGKTAVGEVKKSFFGNRKIYKLGCRLWPSM